MALKEGPPSVGLHFRGSIYWELTGNVERVRLRSPLLACKALASRKKPLASAVLLANEGRPHGELRVKSSHPQECDEYEAVPELKART